MKNETVLIVDAITNIETIRPLTEQEIADRNLLVKELADAQAEIEARQQLRQSAISKLVAGQPLTTAEAELLVIR